MNTIQFLSSQPWVEHLGWTLVHFLWQGALIAAVYSTARAWTARCKPAARYALACAALAAMAAAPLLTLWMTAPREMAGSTAPAAVRTAVATATPSSGIAALPEMVRTTASVMRSSDMLPWIVLFWFAGTMALSVRLMGGWMLAARMRTTMVRPAPPEWQRRIEELAARIGHLRPVRLMVSALVEAPSVVGWLRPVVLVPVGALTGLPPEHIEALLIHELAHVRRYDYLVNVLQSIAEALLFYHPAVWWVSGHIRTERELCCDDTAVAISGDALNYAYALAGLVSTRGGQLDPVLGADGGPLAFRIARLLGRPKAASTSVAPGIVGLTLVAIASLGLFAQSTPRPKFEVASIKPSTEQRFMGVRAQPARLTANAPVRLLMQNAYTLQPFQIIGGPAWIATDYYEIDAKAEGTVSRPQLMQMLQSLLEDRFQLKVRQETRELPVYALVPARGGLKLQTQEGGCVERSSSGPVPLSPGQAPCDSVMVAMSPAGARLLGGKVVMSEFTRVLSNVLGRKVIDRTGFTGRFDVKVDFTPDEATGGMPRSMRPPGVAPPPPSDNPPPSIYTSLQEALGMRLESSKGPVEVLVIDSVQKPSTN